MKRNGNFLYLASQFHGNNNVVLRTQVNANIICWNCVVLLHGPPFTGKMSLCKALTKKLAICISHHHTHGELIEINSHSLFSKCSLEVCTLQSCLNAHATLMQTVPVFCI